MPNHERCHTPSIRARLLPVRDRTRVGRTRQAEHSRRTIAKAFTSEDSRRFLFLRLDGWHDRRRNRSAPLTVYMGMTLLARLHPLFVHFPIALVLVAVAGEAVATLTGNRRWRSVAVANVRAGAAFAVLAAIAGWRLASTPGVDGSSILEWHRWLGTIATVATVGAALATAGADGPHRAGLWTYRIALVGAASLVAATGHLGALSVWGVDFFHP